MSEIISLKVLIDECIRKDGFPEEVEGKKYCPVIPYRNRAGCPYLNRDVKLKEPCTIPLYGCDK